MKETYTMPAPVLVSFGIIGASGAAKRIPVYLESAADEAAIAEAVADLAPLIDAATAGKLTDVLVTKPYALPGGLKASAVAGSHAREGANLSFDAEDTNYRYTVYIPTWKEAGFAGDTVVNADEYAALITALHGAYDTGEIELTDDYGNDLLSYLEGKRTFRK
jgi:hypothetical protein